MPSFQAGTLESPGRFLHISESTLTGSIVLSMQHYNTIFSMRIFLCMNVLLHEAILGSSSLRLRMIIKLSSHRDKAGIYCCTVRDFMVLGSERLFSHGIPLNKRQPFHGFLSEWAPLKGWLSAICEAKHEVLVVMVALRSKSSHEWISGYHTLQRDTVHIIFLRLDKLDLLSEKKPLQAFCRLESSLVMMIVSDVTTKLIGQQIAKPTEFKLLLELFLRERPLLLNMTNCAKNWGWSKKASNYMEGQRLFYCSNELKHSEKLVGSSLNIRGQLCITVHVRCVQ